MEEVLTVDQVVSFNQSGVLVVPGFYDLSEVETIQRGIHSVIGLVIDERKLSIQQAGFAPETFDSGFQELIAHDRGLGGVVYDAVKQIPAFIRLVSSANHEAVIRQLRGTAAPAVVAGGYGIRIDNPQEEKFRAAWHQEYPAQIRSMDGLVFWSPLLPMSEELGPVEFCLGSHKDGVVPVRMKDAVNPEKVGAYGLTLADEAERVKRYDRVAPLTQPGDMVMIDWLVLHRSGENHSNRSRWSMQMRWFNFEEPTGRRLGWPGSFAAGNDFSVIHPELVVN